MKTKKIKSHSGRILRSAMSVLVILCLFSNIAFAGELIKPSSKKRSDHKIRGLKLIPTVVAGSAGFLIGYVAVGLINSIADEYFGWEDPTRAIIAVLSINFIPHGTASGICKINNILFSEVKDKTRFYNTFGGSYIGMIVGGYSFGSIYSMTAGSVLGGILGYNLTKVSTGNAVLNIEKESMSISFPQIYLTRSQYNPKELTLNARLLQVNF